MLGDCPKKGKALMLSLEWWVAGFSCLEPWMDESNTADEYLVKMSVVQCSAVQCCAVPCSAVQWRAVQCGLGLTMFGRYLNKRISQSAT